MARFHFNLEPVLRTREQTEREKQHAVAKLESQRMELEERLRRQQETIASSKRLVRERLVGPLAVPELRGESAVAVRAMRQAQRLALELAGIHRRLESARADLAEATKARRAIELLRDRRFEAWKRAHDKAEQMLLDDLAGRAALTMRVDP